VEGPAGASEPVLSGQVPTTGTHRWFTLIGVSFLVYEAFFLLFYGDSFWFPYEITWWGIPTILLAFAVGHFLLIFVESPAGCHFFSPIWKGRPAIVYRKWVALDESGLTFGSRRVVWEAVDQLALTFFGNLQVWSRSVCGPQSRQPDLVLKVPFGIVKPAYQRKLVEQATARRPGLAINNRLEKRLASRELKGTELVQSLGVVFLLLVLIDLGNSTFSFLEMSKEYYLAQTEAKQGDMKIAQEHFQRAEQIYNHPFPVSWVNTKLLRQGTVAAGVHRSRSEALWELGRRQEAIVEVRKALECTPDAFRFNLRLARLLEETGNKKEAMQQMRLAVDNHASSLLPRLYVLAELLAEDQPQAAARLYQLYMDELKDRVFGEEPWWPPGGNRYLPEVLYSDDARFIFDRLLPAESTKSSQGKPAN